MESTDKINKDTETIKEIRLGMDEYLEPIDTYKPDGLKKMREPFPAHQIGKLPKPTKAQTDSKNKSRCSVCNGWHDPNVVHLDYVGHAPLTDRLLDSDPNWDWEPLAFNEKGLPQFDTDGGLWIKLTVCGVTRLGYGNAAKSQYKDIGSREKEVIGDALRNASMRFGAALDLWHKGDLHIKKDYPKRSYINGKLKECETMEAFLKVYDHFMDLFGEESMDDLSGKRGDKTETWWGVFEPHRKRVNGENPFDANEIPEDLGEENQELESGFNSAIQ